jgi:hypothetical protein
VVAVASSGFHGGAWSSPSETGDLATPLRGPSCAYLRWYQRPAQLPARGVASCAQPSASLSGAHCRRVRGGSRGTRQCHRGVLGVARELGPACADGHRGGSDRGLPHALRRESCLPVPWQGLGVAKTTLHRQYTRRVAVHACARQKSKCRRKPESFRRRMLSSRDVDASCLPEPEAVTDIRAPLIFDLDLREQPFLLLAAVIADASQRYDLVTGRA